ncbi:MAG TPA: hypothetical protein VFN57_13200 [Thermomicrobiaceae bacterium]|nr:hypothetical protein [Thermomicrobiaceae bacterium]
MRLDPRLTSTQLRRALQEQAARDFGPMRASVLFASLSYTAETLALIAAAPVDLTGEAPDRSGVAEGAEEGGREA